MKRFRLTSVKLSIGLENFKGVFPGVWFNIAMTRDHGLSFASVEIDKKLFVDSTPVEKFVSQVVT